MSDGSVASAYPRDAASLRTSRGAPCGSNGIFFAPRAGLDGTETRAHRSKRRLFVRSFVHRSTRGGIAARRVVARDAVSRRREFMIFAALCDAARDDASW